MNPMTKLLTGNQPPPRTQMTIKDNHYPHLMMQTQLTQLGMTQSYILKEPDKLSWV